METLHERRPGESDSRLRLALLSRYDLARLRSESESLLSLADRLEELSANVHTNNRADEARLLATRLRETVSAHLEREAEVMRVVEMVDDAALAEAIDRTRAEHAALEELLAPVMRGLRAIGRDRLPTRLGSFVMATGLLCEYLRLHEQFKRETLYPLIARRQVH